MTTPLHRLVSRLPADTAEAARKSSGDAPIACCVLAVDAIDAGRTEDARALLAKAIRLADLIVLTQPWRKALNVTAAAYGARGDG